MPARRPCAQATWAWWLGQARSVFTERLQHYAPALGVAWRSLRLTNARTRWGSAKRDGSLMLNAKLLHYPCRWWITWWCMSWPTCTR